MVLIMKAYKITKTYFDGECYNRTYKLLTEQFDKIAELGNQFTYYLKRTNG